MDNVKKVDNQFNNEAKVLNYERAQLYKLIVRLGDVPKKFKQKSNQIAASMNQILDAEIQNLNIPTYEPLEATFNEEIFSFWLTRIVTEINFETETTKLIDLVTECITILPHKHSYYASFIFSLFLHYAKNDDFYHKIINVFDNLPHVNVVKSVKVQASEHVKQVTQEDQKFAFYILFLLKICQNVFHKINEVLSRSHSLDEIYKISSALRFLFDLSSFGIFDFTSLIRYVEAVVSRNDIDYAVRVVFFSSLVFINKDLYNVHSELVSNTISNVVSVLDSVRLTADSFFVPLPKNNIL